MPGFFTCGVNSNQASTMSERQPRAKPSAREPET
jgi:hypothetical protein